MRGYRSLLSMPTLLILEDIVCSIPECSTVVCGGVYQGGDVLHMSAARPDCVFHCYDSFQGLPDSGQFAASLDEFRETVGDNPKVIAHPGWITEESLAGENLGPIGMMWLDLDLYQPTKEMLARFLPDSVSQSPVIVHDYYSGHWTGVKKACDEVGEWERVGKRDVSARLKR